MAIAKLFLFGQNFNGREEKVVVDYPKYSTASVGDEWVALGEDPEASVTHNEKAVLIYKDRRGVVILLTRWGRNADKEWADDPIPYWFNLKDDKE